ncbi:hypothetical protein E2P81_ATG00486 [Venturia nashicola]|nr:hypothetical protein E2P81_ATG00486 [Venturia nashicola]
MVTFNSSMLEAPDFLVKAFASSMATLNSSMSQLAIPTPVKSVHLLSQSSGELPGYGILRMETSIVVLLTIPPLGALAAFAAVCYSELLYQGTSYLYRQGKVQRYYPLPTKRYAFTAGMNAFSFIVPSALYTLTVQKDLTRSWSFNPISLFAHILVYMVIHDVYFYLVHTNFHRTRWLYDFFHAMHHELVYAMNVFHTGFAEVSENFIQVGLPWLFWTAIAGSNVWNWILPLSITLFTTLLGHSGYRMNWRFMMFHPLVLPIVLISGKYMLTPGDHQVHHTYRRYNFGLFWRFMDKQGGTYKKPTMRAYDYTHWTKWAAMNAEGSEEAKKWMGRHPVEFAEVAWGL